MEAGLQVLNDHSTFQIDSKYKNLVLIRKTQVTVNPSPSNTVQYLNNAHRYTAAYTNSVVAVSTPSAQPIAVLKASDLAYYITTIGSAAVSIIVYEFRPIIEGAQGSLGLNVYDAQGVLIFDALQPPMRVVAGADASVWNITTAVAQSTHIAVANQRSYAFVLAHFDCFCQNERFPIPTGYRYLQRIVAPSIFYDVANSRITLSGELIATNQEPIATTFEYGGARLAGFVIDITDY